MQRVAVRRIQDRRPMIDGLILSRGNKVFSLFYSADSFGDSHTPPPYPQHMKLTFDIPLVTWLQMSASVALL